MMWKLEIGNWKFVQRIAAEMLGVLVVLYPLLLLLDDIEPGLVRSVLNPHWFLLALIVVAMVVAPESKDRHCSNWFTITGGLVAAIVVCVWMWWKLGGGTLGMVVGALAGLSIAAVAYFMKEEK